MNTQAPTKISTKKVDDDAVYVHSVFHTIQGEGPFVGTPATFIRLFGCNLQCPLCDTDYTTVADILTPMDVYLRVVAITNVSTNLIVISGGEPFRQPIGPLIEYLIEDESFEVQVETNGTAFQPDVPYDLITVVCSPKTGSINKQLLPYINAFKYVAGAERLMDDGLPEKALEHTAKPHLARPPEDFPKENIFLQPADYGVGHENLNQIALNNVINSCLEHGYRLCLQQHKIIGVE